MDMSDRIYIFDTTLRDGEQSPGATMNAGEKIRLARQLERLGVDVIEAGFPAASTGDQEAVAEIAAAVKDCQVAGLCRAVKEDMDKAWEAVKHAAQPRLHTFLATSDIHMKYKLDKTREQVLEIAHEAVTYAGSLCPSVEFSAEDASRSDPAFLVQVVQTAIDAGAKVINIPDTVGYAQPQEYAELIDYLLTNVKESERAIFSVHCHNDLGLGVANTLAACKAGARQAEVTLSGIGERAGNAALEELVMALNVRKGFYNLETGINTEQIYPSCRLLSMIIGQPIPPYKPIIGGNAFAHESGIHQAGMLKNRETYEIMTPASIGKAGSDIVIGKHSGRHALNQKLEELGYRLTRDQLTQVSEVVKSLADKKKKLYMEDVEAIVLEEVYRIPDKFKLIYLSSISGNMAIPTAAMKMEVLGEEKQLSDFGVGAIDAVFNTIDRLVQRNPTLLRYSVSAITGGADAQGEVTVKLEENSVTSVGRAADPDVIVASAKAYINALNRLAKKETDPKAEQSRNIP
ncbi:2-isopropylmalate synthase [Desulfonatronospira sp. MSAO_Bac3]|uniref:2-isopropylmalate synthase n=1 Tax=Desulfonatronospira sp. MSAO_Bac3 TaxID=2293857 RepID=UPI000FF0F06C|nr:2-isopropylmalate synthase [Desulfonatronospira sp. MSAO_Bac3]RQD73469.1 MAG: 2-isopropylmalate synthase [Desulfonatronospira sp. MSAO_Bac3]